jgi:hypothetical protein
MLRLSIRAALSAALLIALSAGLTAAPQVATKKAPPRVNASAAVIQEFLKRVDGYVVQHKKLEDTLPPLPKQTTPQQIDAHQRALALLIQTARKEAKPGDLLTPAMQQRIRTLLRPIFAGKEGQQIKNEILDNEYKGNVKLAVNGRYPDDVPVSTMPPQVLAALPKLPGELEYRFILNSLILFDTHAHIIVDFMERGFI